MKQMTVFQIGARQTRLRATVLLALELAGCATSRPEPGAPGAVTVGTERVPVGLATAFGPSTWTHAAHGTPSSGYGSPGSDLWPVTWADDGLQYTAWGDGEGFSNGTYVSWGIATLAGGPVGYTAADLYRGPTGGRNGHIVGMICLDGVIYLIKSDLDTPTEHFQLYKSADHFATGPSAVSGVIFPKAGTSIYPHSFIQFGQNNGDAVDSYVYAVGQGESGSPAGTYLFRVPAANIETPDSWEVFSGTPSSPAWSTDFAQAQAILSTGSGFDAGNRIIYLELHGGVFILIEGSPFVSMTLSWGLHPYGPFTPFARFPGGLPPFAGRSPSVSVEFAPKWCNGGDLWLIFSGANVIWDSFNVVGAPTLKWGPLRAVRAKVQ
jgi:hypothetical protein